MVTTYTKVELRVLRGGDVREQINTFDPIYFHRAVTKKIKL